MRFKYYHSDSITCWDIAVLIFAATASAVLSALAGLLIFGILFNVINVVGLWDPIYEFFFQHLFYPPAQ